MNDQESSDHSWIFDLSPDQFSLSEFCDRYDER